MANWFKPTPEQVVMWKAWVAERPESIRAVAEKFPPWTLYRMHDDEGNPTQRVRVLSIAEPGSHHTCESHGEKHCETTNGPTLTVLVSGEYNLVSFERRVFGITPERLVECDLPTPDEFVGSMDLTPDEATLPAGRRNAIMLARAVELAKKRAERG